MDAQIATRCLAAAIGPAQKLATDFIMLERPPATIFVLVILGWLVLLPFLPAYIAAPADLRVFAAASLNEAIDASNVRYQRVTGRRVVASVGGSDTLARRIENGAPADIFISADIDWMDHLARSGLIKPKTRLNFLGNKLVLIASADSAPSLAIVPNFPLAQALGDGRLAIANPDSVPAGKYGKAALEALGVWASVESKLAPAPDVRAALDLVARHEAPFGIVYLTDAVSDPRVDIVGTFPSSSHPPIIYPLAVTAASTNPAAESYIAFLQSPVSAPAFVRQGFARVR
jgi:molybdate transport system substrate-binding protein